MIYILWLGVLNYDSNLFHQAITWLSADLPLITLIDMKFDQNTNIFN